MQTALFSNVERKKDSRLRDIDVAKGIAITLVVFGHIVARQPPDGAELYTEAKRLVYSFHMPFFMYLSGFVSGYSYRPSAYGPYVKKRFVRLIPAYLLFSIIVFAGKVGAQLFLTVDNPVESAWSFFDILWHPTASYSSFLWYVHTLFLLSMMFPFYWKLPRNIQLWVIGPAAILSYFSASVPYWFGFDMVCQYTVYFVVGAYLSGSYKEWRESIDKTFAIWASLFLFACLVRESLGIPKLVMGLLSIPTFHGVARWRPIRESSALQMLGGYTFAIYLMNTISIGVLKTAITSVISWDGINFLFIGPILLAGGVLVPIAMKKWVIPFFPWLDRITS